MDLSDVDDLDHYLFEVDDLDGDLFDDLDDLDHDPFELCKLACYTVRLLLLLLLLFSH